MVRLTILSTSDLHGYLYPTDFREQHQSLPFGAFKVKERMNQLAQEVGSALIKIDNGDFLQGSPLSYYVAKEKSTPIMADVMNDMGYDAGVLGNHEFNYGLSYLKENLARLDYPVLCANILDETGAPLTGHAYHIIEREGVKIAILGLTTSYIPHWEQPSTIKGLEFLPVVETAQKYIPELKKQADIVVVSYHGGFERDLETGEPTEMLTGENEGYELLHHVPGIDVLLTGHQHRELTFETDTCVGTQPGDKGRFMGCVTLEIEDTTRQVLSRSAELLTPSEQVDETLSQTYLPLLEEVNKWLDQEIGEVDGTMWIEDPMAVRAKGHPYIEFINQVQMDATGTDISGTALFDNNGKGFGASITMRDIVTNYIYPNTLAVVRITGADLKAALERSAGYFAINHDGTLTVSPAFLEPKTQHFNYDMYAGISYTLDIRQPVGQRVTALTYAGKPVTDDQILEVAMNQYRAVGGGDYTMFGADKIVKEVTVDMTELIADFLKKHPKLTPITEHTFDVIY
ncbi:bifunctional metallophosphatase/5'-nucleotidase [Vagococcus lutrae]|uniref:bifunctional metallophosphatase/5'-nucleotidase n=1 Tax=Vagococcus lutrae TaxID=81947 RepID=UPI00200F7532|nr:bifunctional UDP-sugar hydrolase/5'-nucleotidase [Vagococcus lutrae]MDT2806674.1 bifunctional UDP-sugar hydrolase/5'-nucleotidase [Vagococcus lutrae]MDT2824424.1 bifunctional UDP-sugar hydrolase/5'-nucleotidase [Vagococcus lutrae]UQF18245.1 bifunctional metallophosphatase/5'-nucleotidase [Vagococcus lutrae]